MDCKSLDDHRGDAEEIDRVLPHDTLAHMMIDDIVNEADIPLRAAVGFDASSSSIKMSRQVERPRLGAGGCPPSKNNGNFVDPMASLLKPSSQMAAVYRGNGY